MIDLSDLEAKALAATPGEWLFVRRNHRQAYIFREDFGPNADPDCAVVNVDPSTGEYARGVARDEDAAFIAAASPAVILELVARLRAAEAKEKEKP